MFNFRSWVMMEGCADLIEILASGHEEFIQLALEEWAWAVKHEAPKA